MDQTFLTGGTPQTTYKNKPKVEAKESARPLSSDARSAVVSKLFEKAVDNKYGVRETFRMVVDLIYYALGRDEPHYMELVKQLEPRTVELATQIYCTSSRASTTSRRSTITSETPTCTSASATPALASTSRLGRSPA